MNRFYLSPCLNNVHEINRIVELSHGHINMSLNVQCVSHDIVCQNNLRSDDQ